MNLVVNGKERCWPEEITIAGAIAQQGLNSETVVVEHNYAIVPKERWSQIILQENDKLEILSFMGGG